MMRALAATGGVMQVVAFASYVKTQPPERQQAVAALRAEFGITGGRGAPQGLDAAARVRYDSGMADIEARWPGAHLRDFIDHVDYAVRLIGIDHVGISSDFDGGGGINGWNDASETFNLTLELVRRGYSEEDIRKIWGGNLLRAWRDMERVARELQAER
jgi:membrane dipeptidase